MESISGQIEKIKKIVGLGHLNSALNELSAVFLTLQNSPSLLGRSLNIPAFDHLCQDIGEASCYALFGASCKPVPEPHDVILITNLNCHGGHGEIVKDIAALNDLPVLVVATNLHELKIPILGDYLTDPNILGIEIAEGKTALDRLRDIQQRLVRPSVRRIFMLHHGHDAIANAAATRDLSAPVYFLHHCDHTPALGCHLENVVHVDLHNLSYHRCRHDDGIASNRYLCLTARGGKVRAPARFASPFFKTASCGGEHKIHSPSYPIGYADLVVEILRIGQGRHHHIGPLSKGLIATVQRKLADANIDPAHFIHVGSAPQLADILHCLEIDLYFPTMPQGGGKGIIEAMSAGVPVLIHENGADRLWSGRDLAYPEALSWRTLKDLNSLIGGFDEVSWKYQSEAARRYFSLYHAPAKFAEMLILAKDEPILPPLKPYRPDPDIRLQYALSKVQ
ncbi:hypothetical protein LG047_06800 [Methylocystis sp. WRRC1]|uniref:hypothetical protein n=1 Tax=Methylocystis sp. WRRC1 TaxID=1732014 RepID=UPI001D13F89C|nr:hypothetical protein [Methylocystis sp. WRRC1]MCC3245032.1 hypothetical protein [Methylocystis sp. WRRC1]